ncbi:hypothetical protein SPHV1_610028 [Novosphingobium sp. KN65.2]|nr:hypothetical protein SPHV1_610028 [Novosphingobium sp. KN65.2]
MRLSLRSCSFFDPFDIARSLVDGFRHSQDELTVRTFDRKTVEDGGLEVLHGAANRRGVNLLAGLGQSGKTLAQGLCLVGIGLGLSAPLFRRFVRLASPFVRADRDPARLFHVGECRIDYAGTGRILAARDCLNLTDQIVAVARRFCDQGQQQCLQLRLVENPPAPTAAHAATAAEARTAGPTAATVPTAAFENLIVQSVTSRPEGTAHAAPPSTHTAGAPYKGDVPIIIVARETPSAALGVTVHLSHLISIDLHDRVKIYLRRIFARREFVSGRNFLREAVQSHFQILPVIPKTRSCPRFPYPHCTPVTAAVGCATATRGRGPSQRAKR